MRYGSVCSGIEAATVAWHPLGWTPAFFSEIDAFPRAVLAHHYPEVPLHGDFTTIGQDDCGAIDLLVGGTPCQSFSVAGLRGGLADDRGNLVLEYLRLADRKRPRWLVWENVPGVLSADEGRAFGSFLGGLAELGYGWAYRVLDAQYFGVAQRRRRVFVVGYLGDWRPAAAVLFERHSLSGYPAPSRETREEIAGGTRERAAFGGNNQSGPIDVATAVNAHGGAHGRLDFESETFIAHSLRAEGFDASEDGTGRGTPPLAAGAHAPAVAFTQNQQSEVRLLDVAAALGTGGVVGSQQTYLAQAFDLRGREDGSQFEGPHDTANIRASSGGSSRSYVVASAVRRLTPRECERLQGFPDDYTLIPYRGKPAADGPRYKALGNSMAVPCMAWIGRRIQMMEDLALATAEAAE